MDDKTIIKIIDVGEHALLWYNGPLSVHDVGCMLSDNNVSSVDGAKAVLLEKIKPLVDLTNSDMDTVYQYCADSGKLIMIDIKNNKIKVMDKLNKDAESAVESARNNEVKFLYDNFALTNTVLIDNIDLIKGIIKFDTKDDFYHVMVMQRTKEVKDARIIKQYIVRKEDLEGEKFLNILKDRCRENNARAYINPNRKSFHDVTLKTIKDLTTCVITEEYSHVQDKFFSACGQIGTNYKKYWVVDIDTKDAGYIKRVRDFISTLEPNVSEDKTVLEVPTKNGVHLITTPFNLKKFTERYPNIDIHKNEFTLLYYEGV